MYCCCLLLYLRIENILAIYRLYINNTSYEYEATIILTLVKIINTLEGESYHEHLTFFDKICCYTFNIILISNLLTYIIAFLTIMIYFFFMFVGSMSGNQNINLNRGLTHMEIDSLDR